MKKKTSALCVVILLILVGRRASAEDAWRTYIGKSNCIPELSSPINRYGVRLDRAQKAYLIVYKFKDSEIAVIVQYQDDGNDRKRCGVIRDVTRVREKDSSVVWECSDRRMPAEIVIGTWPAKHPKPFGVATDAWRVDLKELKFIPIDQAPKFVFCHPKDGRGNDAGDGLSDLAKKKAKSKRRE